MKSPLLSLILLTACFTFPIQAFAKNCNFAYWDEYASTASKYTNGDGSILLSESIYQMITRNYPKRISIKNELPKVTPYKVGKSTLTGDKVCVLGDGPNQPTDIYLRGSGLILIPEDKSASKKNETYYYNGKITINLKQNSMSISEDDVEIIEIGELLKQEVPILHRLDRQYLCYDQNQEPFKEQNKLYGGEYGARTAAYMIARDIVSKDILFDNIKDMLVSHSYVTDPCTEKNKNTQYMIRGLLNVPSNLSKTGKKEMFFFKTSITHKVKAETMEKNYDTVIDMSSIIQ